MPQVIMRQQLIITDKQRIILTPAMLKRASATLPRRKSTAKKRASTQAPLTRNRTENRATLCLLRGGAEPTALTPLDQHSQSNSNVT